MRLRIAGYAYTIGPAGLIKAIGAAAKTRGHDVLLLEANKRGVVFERKEEMKGCDIVLLGLSSDGIDEEIELFRFLHEQGIPVVVLGDVPDSWARPDARHIAALVTHCIVTMPYEIEAAKEFGYPSVSYEGPPQHWGDSYVSMMEGDGLRPLLKKNVGDEVAELSHDDRIVYVPGTKIPDVVNMALEGVLKTGPKILGSNFILGFRKHGGEKPNPKKEGEAERYQKLWAERENMFRGVTMLHIDEPYASDPLINAKLVGAADVTVYPGGGPTESIVAAYAKKPGIYCWNSIVADGLKGIGITSGQWFVAERGGVLKATSVDELEKGMASLLTPEGEARLRFQQDENFHPSIDWNSAPKVVQLLENIVRHRSI